MQYSKIALGCALACAAISAQAASVPVPAGTTTIYLSGASAPDNFLADIAGGMMTGVTTISATNYKGFLGKANNIPGIANGTDLLFIKRSAGGSAYGVDPVARANRIATLDLNNCTGGGAAYTCGLKGIDPGSAGNEDPSNVGIVPDFGVSDVEAKMFKEPYNTENNQPALTSEEVARLAVSPVNQIMMGIAATNAVSTTAHISRSAYGAMLAGKIQDWSAIDGSSDPVIVCRRVDGSGTQASYNWFFSGFPCNATDSGFLSTPPSAVTDSAGYMGGSGTDADPYIIDPSAGFTVVENSGSGDVRNCLKNAQSKTDHIVKGEFGATYKVLFSNLANPGKAIGVLSLDSYGSASGSNGWMFRTLDGAGTFNAATQTASAGATGMAPSKDNLLNGKYDFVVELAMQYRNTEVTNVNGDVVPALSGTKLAFAQEFIKRAGDTKYTGNDGGTFTSVPNAYASLPQYYDYNTKPNYVAKYSREGNTCAPLVRY